MTPAQFDALTQQYLNSEKQSDYRVALICCLIANCFRDTSKKSEPFTVEDFMPEGETKRELTTEETTERFRILALQTGAEMRIKDGR